MNGNTKYFKICQETPFLNMEIYDIARHKAHRKKPNKCAAGADTDNKNRVDMEKQNMTNWCMSLMSKNVKCLIAVCRQ